VPARQKWSWAIGEKGAREVEVEATYSGVHGLWGAILVLFHYLGERLVVWILEGGKRKRKKGDKREKKCESDSLLYLPQVDHIVSDCVNDVV